jgi:hypothetical protein
LEISLCVILLRNSGKFITFQHEGWTQIDFVSVATIGWQLTVQQPATVHFVVFTLLKRKGDLRTQRVSE